MRLKLFMIALGCLMASALWGCGSEALTDALDTALDAGKNQQTTKDAGAASKDGGATGSDAGTAPSDDAATGTDSGGGGTDSGGGDDVSAPDAEADAGETDSGTPGEDATAPDTGPPPGGKCDITKLGPVFKVVKMEIAGRGEGFDLNGDGKNDNALASVGSLANKPLQEAVDKGDIVLLVEVANLDDPKSDNDVTLNMYLGKPGTGPTDFTVDPSSLDANGCAVVTIPKAKANNGTVEGGPKDIALSITLGGGPSQVNLVAGRVKFTLAPDLSKATNGMIGGVIRPNSFDKIPDPLDSKNPNRTLLDRLAELPLLKMDIDLDKDGIEAIGKEGGDIVCTDGNKSKIPGRACVNDPKIADGYSAAIKAEATKATISGVAAK